MVTRTQISGLKSPGAQLVFLPPSSSTPMEEKSNLPRPVFGVLGASAWQQWPTGLSLLALRHCQDSGKGDTMSQWTSHCHCVSKVQLFQALFTEHPIYLGFLSAGSQAAGGEKDAPFLTIRENMNRESRRCWEAIVFSPQRHHHPPPTPSPPHGTREAGFVCFPWRM